MYVNGDGLADLVFGVRFFGGAPPDGGGNQAVGGVIPGPLEGDHAFADAEIQLDSAASWANGGIRVAGGQGPDLLLAAPAATLTLPVDGTAWDFPGSTWLLRGPLEDGVQDVGDAALRIGGRSGGAADPVAVFAGDPDGDGADEILVGGWGDDTRGADAGAVWLVGE